MAVKTKIGTVQLPIEYIEILRDLAKAQDRSMSSVARQLILRAKAEAEEKK